MDGALLVGLAALAGVGFGYGADRLAARWPPHEGRLIRPTDWRTALVVAAGGVAFGALAWRFGGTMPAIAVVGLYVAALVVLFATDLDQRLLPDLITLPLIAFAVVVLAAGWSPFIRSNDQLLWAVIAAIAVPLGLGLLAIPFGAGAIGQGDLKLLVSVGLLAGAERLVYGLFVGTAAAGVVIVVLVLARRITMRSYVPYGPFLIGGAMWGLLGLSSV